MTIASSPLIITLRHIFVAPATPRLLLQTRGAKPRLFSSGASEAASGPPSNSGTCRRCGGTAAITAPSTYLPPPPPPPPPAPPARNQPRGGALRPGRSGVKIEKERAGRQPLGARAGRLDGVAGRDGA